MMEQKPRKPDAAGDEDRSHGGARQMEPPDEYVKDDVQQRKMHREQGIGDVPHELAASLKAFWRPNSCAEPHDRGQQHEHRRHVKDQAEAQRRPQEQDPRQDRHR